MLAALLALAARIPAAGLSGDQLREAASEFGAVSELVSQALRDYYKADRKDGSEWIWPRLMYADRVVLVRNGRYYQHAYTITDENTARLGEPVEVTIEPVPVASKPGPGAETMTEARRDGWFVEAVAAGDDNKPPRYLVRVIRSGVSLNNVDYPAKVLRESAPKFNGVRVFFKPDDVHVKGGGKDVTRLAGKLSNARFVETTRDAGEIQAEMDVLQSSQVADQLREAVERGMTDLFGLSIDAVGTTTTRGNVREAKSITKVLSVDLIIEPGAGGQVLRFTEAQQEPDTMLRQQMLDTIRRRDPARADALAGANDDLVISAYREAVAAEAVAGNASTTMPPALTRAELDAHTKLIEARADARVVVNAARIPQAAKDRLLSRFAEATDAADLSAEKVQAAIKAEADYGNAFRESAPVSGLGDFARPKGDTETVAQATRRMLDNFFAGDNGTSIREAYIQITGDQKVSGNFSNCDPGRLSEARGVMREAISASTFADILGDSITRAMQREYKENKNYQDWRDLVDVVPIRDFRMQERGLMGGYGNLPTVAENGPYAALTSPGDDKATYNVTKRGGIETVSLESFANDDVGLIRRIPRSLARAAGRTLYEFIYSFLDANPVIFDGLALFVAGHNNLGTAPLSATSFAASRLRMNKQVERDSLKRLGLTATHLYLPPDLEETGYDLFVRNSNQDETFVQSRKPKVHVVAHWTDTNNWFATADKDDVPLIELGFLNGQEEPEIFIQDNPTQGSLFNNDQVKYKMRHVYGAAIMDFRGFDGSIVP
jgi:hypothetical protein